MHTSIETVTVGMAKEWLATNVNNRSISQPWVSSLAAMMRHGQWQLTHEGILLGKNGMLLDGQHRLLAIIRAGIPCRMCVTRDESQNSVIGLAVNIGLPRSAAFIFNTTSRRIGVTNFLARILLGRNVAKSELKPFIEMVDAIYHNLIPVGKETATRIFTSAPVVVAALVLLKLQPEHASYYRETYSSLSRNDPKGLPPKAYSFWRQFASAKSFNQTDLYIRAIRGMDFSSRTVSKLQFKNKESAWEEAVLLTREAFPLPESIV